MSVRLSRRATLRAALTSAAVGSALLAAAPLAQAKAVDATIRVKCDFGFQYYGIAPFAVKVTGTVPDQTAPGQAVDLSNVKVKLDLAYLLTQMPTVPVPPPNTVYAHLFDFTYALKGATAAQLASASVPQALPPATETSTYLGDFDPTANLGTSTLTTAGAAPVVVRLGSFGHGLQTVRGDGPEPTGIPQRTECKPVPGQPPIAVVPSTGPVPGPPTITSISPDRADVLGGTVVTIKGRNLASTNSVVPSWLDQLPFEVVDDQTITLTTRKVYAPHLGYLQLWTDFGQTEPTTFTYTDAPPAEPTITSLSPRRGADQGPVEVTLTGTNLNRLERVDFGPTASADIVEASADGTTARVRLASSISNVGATEVDVRAKGIPGCVDDCLSENTPADDFEFYDVGPQVWGLWPTNDPAGNPKAGDSVSFNGYSLDRTTGVKFGDVPATSFKVLGASTIQAIVPPGVVGTVRVTALGQPSGVEPLDTPSDEITIIGGTPPTVDKIWHEATANVGGLVALTGSDFTKVKSIRVGAAAVRPTLVAGSKTLWFFAPKLAAGSYPVTVTTLAGGESQASLTKLLTYR